jgi:hypothetical protein
MVGERSVRRSELRPVRASVTPQRARPSQSRARRRALEWGGGCRAPADRWFSIWVPSGAGGGARGSCSHRREGEYRPSVLPGLARPQEPGDLSGERASMREGPGRPPECDRASGFRRPRSGTAAASIPVFVLLWMERKEGGIRGEPFLSVFRSGDGLFHPTPVIPFTRNFGSGYVQLPISRPAKQFGGR